MSLWNLQRMHERKTKHVFVLLMFKRPFSFKSDHIFFLFRTQKLILILHSNNDCSNLNVVFYFPHCHRTRSFRTLIRREPVHIFNVVSDCSLTEGAAFVLCAFHGAIRQHLEVEAVSAVEPRDDALQLGLCRPNTGLKGVSIQERAHAHWHTPIMNACTAICDF